MILKLGLRKDVVESKIKMIEARAALRAYIKSVTGESLRVSDQYVEDVNRIHTITLNTISNLRRMTSFEDMDNLVNSFTIEHMDSLIQ